MSSDGRLHALLPWHVNGTLEGAEAESFRSHLEQCGRCRDEMAFLETVRDRIAEHGAAFLADHPTPERLVATVRGELDDAAAEEVRLHLALCTTCTLEARWVCGESVATATTKRRSGRPAVWNRPWILAAAALLALALIVQPWLRRDAGAPARSGVVQPQFVAPVERGDEPQVVAASAVGQALRLSLEIDLPRAAFPVRLKLIDSGEVTIRSVPGIRFEDLTEGLYLFFDCHAPDCTAGESYRVSIEAADGSPPIEFRFRVE